MTYRALFTADIHIGNRMPWAVKNPETLVSDRALDIIAVLDQMMEYALDNDIVDIWILGDLIHNRLVDAVTLKLVTAALIHLQQVGLTVRLIPGNHEAGDAAGLHFTLDQFAEMGFWVAGISDAAKDQISFIEPVDGFQVLAMPYLPLSRAVRLADGPRVQLALIHQAIKGGTAGGWVCPDGMEPMMLESIAAQTLSGHFHTPQSIGDRVHYLGAPVQHTFGDAGEERGFWDITWTGQDCNRQMVLIRDPVLFRELEWQVKSESPPNISSEVITNSYNTIKVVGPDAVIKKRMPAVEQWCQELRVQGARLARAVPVPTSAAKRARIRLDGDGEGAPTWPKLLSTYLDTADCTGLNRQRLEELGMELVADVDK